MSEETMHKHININADSLDIGAPSKGGAIKIYGDFNKMDEFKKKLENAVALRVIAQELLEVDDS